MNQKNEYPNRKSNRMKGYDYSLAGAYFVTIVTHLRQSRLGVITNGNMQLSHLGKITRFTLEDLANHYPRILLDAYIIMPNHVHFIIVLRELNQTTGQKEKPVALSEVIRAFKSYSAKHVNQYLKTTGSPFWQRGYHDRIIRNQTEWDQIRAYIELNPNNWKDDPEFRD